MIQNPKKRRVYLLLLSGLIGILTGYFIIFGHISDYLMKSALSESTDISYQKSTKKKYSKYEKPEMYTKYFRDITTKIYENESSYSMNYKTIELLKAKERAKSLKLNKAPVDWVMRGPANVGGRTRAFILDPDDISNNTWIVGAASGGIWRTIDGGSTWTDISGELTNLAVNTMAMANTNRNIIYAGTGESFPGGTYLKGNGIWKSTDRGGSWTQLSSTSSDNNFAYINRIIVDPADEDIVLAATETGIFKSINGGISWTSVYTSAYGVEDLIADPTSFNTLFAGENSKGILRSTDAGDNWELSSNGIPEGSRIEVCVSEVDHNYVYASMNVSSTESHIYFSDDNGINWKKFNDSQHFLGGQGEYDNAIIAHPYIADEVYVGGVDLWKVKFNGSETLTDPEVLKAYAENTDFLSFVNFSAEYLGGSLSISEGTNIQADDWTSVEIRFGPGISQKAHRFTVPDQATSGVPTANYTYRDYIDVPFEVWDVTNNIQLMVSFRDQEQDGAFNLYERTGENYGELGREYIYVNAVAYDENNPDPNIATQGGVAYKALYMLWSVLADGETWNPSALPVSKIVVDYGQMTLQNGVKTIVADSYSRFGGTNDYDQSSGFGTTSIPGLHPDHHKFIIIPQGDPNFTFIDANDGGIGVSYDNGNTFDQIPDNYITTQFYGVAKHPSKNEYFGGMQDNGTWQSPYDIDASVTTDYFFRIGGDGFECLWHADDPDKMLGSVYNNDIRRSTDMGGSWESSSTGISTNDGPFITRLSASKENADLVFAVGNRGVYRSENFGRNWDLVTISNNWAVEETVNSTHNVEVSLANGKIVWAGGGMATDYGLQIQVSTNYGKTFKALDDYQTVSMDAYISGIATHPVDQSTAYILFSLADSPKILRTTNLGESWEDISGFGTSDESSNGFPDVVTHCLLVMPHNPDIIWVGTDIGLFESTDNGVSWHIADNGIPAVSVYDMQIVDDQVVVATHGKGIWTADFSEFNNVPYVKSFELIENLTTNIAVDLKVNFDKLELYINGQLDKTITSPTTGILNIEKELENYEAHSAYVIGFIGADTYYSNTIHLNLSIPEEINKNLAVEILNISPNPNTGYTTYYVSSSVSDYDLNVYDLRGQNVYSKTGQTNLVNNSVDLSFLKNGMYILQIKTPEEKFSKLFFIAR